MNPEPTTPLEDALIDHQAKLQRQVNQLRRELLCCLAAGLALALAVGLLTWEVHVRELVPVDVG